MFYELDFNKDSIFFEQSPTLKFMKEQLSENNHLAKISPDLINVSIQLWAESIIKHNLDINMTRVEHLSLISEQNSKLVLKTIGKVMSKPKDQRTDEDFQVLMEQGMVSNYLQMITLSSIQDICSNLKKEFKEFQTLKIATTKKNKP